MPRRWSELDSDAERLPEGMERIGYDADTQVYTFRDADGSLWEGAPGCRFGAMHQVSGPTVHHDNDDDDDDEESQPSSAFFAKETTPRQRGPPDEPPTWRADMLPLLNFFLLVAVVLLVLMYALSRPTYSTEAQTGSSRERECAVGMERYVVREGDTCWAIAQEKGVEVEELVAANEGMECDALGMGEVVCLPV